MTYSEVHKSSVYISTSFYCASGKDLEHSLTPEVTSCPLPVSTRQRKVKTFVLLVRKVTTLGFASFLVSVDVASPKVAPFMSDFFRSGRVF